MEAIGGQAEMIFLISFFGVKPGGPKTLGEVERTMPRKGPTPRFFYFS